MYFCNLSFTINLGLFAYKNNNLATPIPFSSQITLTLQIV